MKKALTIALCILLLLASGCKVVIAPTDSSNPPDTAQPHDPSETTSDTQVKAVSSRLQDCLNSYLARKRGEWQVAVMDPATGTTFNSGVQVYANDWMGVNDDDTLYTYLVGTVYDYISKGKLTLEQCEADLKAVMENSDPMAAERLLTLIGDSVLGGHAAVTQFAQENGGQIAWNPRVQKENITRSYMKAYNNTAMLCKLYRGELSGQSATSWTVQMSSRPRSGNCVKYAFPDAGIRFWFADGAEENRYLSSMGIVTLSSGRTFIISVIANNIKDLERSKVILLDLIEITRLFFEEAEGTLTEDPEDLIPTGPNEDFIELITGDLTISTPGETYALFKYSSLPSNEIRWTSSDETVATVDDHGNVTAVKEGTTVITANCRSISEICTVHCRFDGSPEEPEEPEKPEEPTEVRLFDLDIYSQEGYGVKGLVHENEIVDSSGYLHTDCYSLQTNKEKGNYLRYKLDRKYSKLTGTFYAFDEDNNLLWLEFYNGDTLLYITPQLSIQTPRVDFSIDVSGVDYLTVVPRNSPYTNILHNSLIIADQFILTADGSGSGLTPEEYVPDSYRLFDLDFYSKYAYYKSCIDYCTEQEDSSGYIHKNCYDVYGDKESNYFVRYDLDGKYSRISGTLYTISSNTGTLWLDFYDGETYLFSTPKLGPTQSTVSFSYDISGVKYLTMCPRQDKNDSNLKMSWMIADQITIFR